MGGSDGLRRIEVNPNTVLTRYLGVLGMPGLAAYAGVKRLMQVKPGEQVLISSAAGAVGLVAGQICKCMGARVVGSTSTAEKVRTVRSAQLGVAGIHPARWRCVHAS